jgi:Flp pilus assembly protein TadD
MTSGDSNALHLARHYLDSDRGQAALDALERATSDELETSEYWAIRSQALVDLGRYDDSAKAARRGLNQAPEDIELLDLLAISELQRGFSKLADEALAKALALSPEHPVLLAHRALLLADRGDFEGAKAAIAQAVQIAPEWQSVLRIRAQVAILGSDKRAGEYVEELLRLDPNDRVAHALRGSLASEQKSFVAASRAFNEAARLNPGDAELVDVAREARVHAHPVLAPARAVWRFGRWRSYLLYLTLVILLAAAGLESLRRVLVAIWLVIAFLTWFGPGLIRRHQKRKYGGF